MSASVSSNNIVLCSATKDALDPVAMRFASIFKVNLEANARIISVRSTNVYEDQSLGVFADDDDSEEWEPNREQPRIAIWGQYLAWHARRQLAFGMSQK